MHKARLLQRHAGVSICGLPGRVHQDGPRGAGCSAITRKASKPFAKLTQPPQPLSTVLCAPKPEGLCSGINIDGKEASPLPLTQLLANGGPTQQIRVAQLLVLFLRTGYRWQACLGICLCLAEWGPRIELVCRLDAKVWHSTAWAAAAHRREALLLPAA